MHTPTASRRYAQMPSKLSRPVSLAGSFNRPQAQWQETGRLIDSLIEDLVEGDELTTLRRQVPSRQAVRVAPPLPARAKPPLPLNAKLAARMLAPSEGEDSTDVMTSLPSIEAIEAWASAEETTSRDAVSGSSRPTKILNVTATAPEGPSQDAPVPPPANATAPVRKPSPFQLASRAPLGSRVSLSAIDTSLLTLSPEFLEALKQTAPRKRFSKKLLAAGLALAAFLGVLVAQPSARQLVSDAIASTTQLLPL